MRENRAPGSVQGASGNRRSYCDTEMKRGLFITGTDTGCGKTEITLGLMHRLRTRSVSVLGMKPVATGATRTPEGLRNEDALRIQGQCSDHIPYEWVNPFAYEPPIAPHLAAEAASRPIDVQTIVDDYIRLSDLADWVVVEGVGGWSVPLDREKRIADLACRLDLPVVLVVSLQLGCINHALLSEACIRQSGVRFAGWVANQVAPGMDAREGNLRSLRERLSVFCLGEVFWLLNPSPAEVGAYLDVQSL